MARTNTPRVRASVSSPVTSEATSSGPTHQGGPGFARDTKSELFLLAVANFVGEDSFYEDAQGRDTRFADLVQRATAEDPVWTARLLRWLRTDANMRTASIVGAAEFVRSRQQALDPTFDTAEDGPTARSVVSSVIQRADEPGEMIAYWLAKYGRTMPSALKRGIGDAVLRLYNERNYLKWDSAGRGVRFADVLNMVHVGDRKGSSQDIRGDWQHDLFGYIVKTPHQDGLEIPESLPAIRARAELSRLDTDGRHRFMRQVQAGHVESTDQFRLALAGQWEWAKSWLGA